MGFEVEMGSQEISTQSGKNIHHGSGVCGWEFF
jgi:hypothetical protein